MNKQVAAGFYSPYHYVTSVVFSHFPLALVETTLFCTLLYFICGFTADAGRYFFFILISFLLNLAMSGMFRAVAYATPNPDVALNMAGPITAFAMLFGGFLISRQKIPNYAIWIYWLSPFSWGLRSDAQNEFGADRYDFDFNGARAGNVYLEQFNFYTDKSWKWGGVGYLAGLFLFTTLLSAFALAKSHRWLTEGTRRDDEAQTDDKTDEIQVRVGSAMRSSARDKLITSEEDAIPFERMNLTWTDLKYVVPVVEKGPDGKPIHCDRQLLAGVNGFARAGELTALMGSSGAGKTTLMDVIAGRKTSGTITGQILINGHPQTFPSFARISGYCEQTDIHLGTDTVRGAVEFSARLRLPASVTSEQRRKFVNQILDDLELTALGDRLIGDANIKGLSPGQLKRVTIAVELAANPTFLFLDEPVGSYCDIVPPVHSTTSDVLLLSLSSL